MVVANLTPTARLADIVGFTDTILLFQLREWWWRDLEDIRGRNRATHSSIARLDRRIGVTFRPEFQKMESAEQRRLKQVGQDFQFEQDSDPAKAKHGDSAGRRPFRFYLFFTLFLVLVSRPFFPSSALPAPV